MAKVRIGHFAEAEVLQALEVDFIDESEVLTPADEENHIWKHDYRIPFVCGARNLGEALRRIAEGAAMIRTKGEAGSGNVVEAVRHMRTIVSQMKKLTTMRDDELMREAKELGAPLELFRGWHCNSCRRRTGSQPGRGSCLRRLRHFQIKRSRSPRQSRGQGHNALRRSQSSPRSQRRTRRSHAGSGRSPDAGKRPPIYSGLVSAGASNPSQLLN
jgi:hypothetical protein